MKIAIYARISTTDKKQDLDTQLIPLKEFVEARNWSLHRIYTDELSGSKEDRPELQKLMNDAQKRKFDAVLVFRFDRFARSTKQLINALENFKSLNIDFISYQENVDTTTPAGKMMFTMISAFAEFEREIIRERVRAGIVKARAKGKRIGRPKKEVNLELVRRLKAAGMSVRRIAKMVQVGKSTISTLC